MGQSCVQINYYFDYIIVFKALYQIEGVADMHKYLSIHTACTRSSAIKYFRFSVIKICNKIMGDV